MYRRVGRGRLTLLVFLALSIVIVTLDFRGGDTGPFERAKDISSEIVAPLQRALTAVVRPVGNFFSSLGELSQLRSENARLRDELRGLEGEVEQADAIAEENRRLTELLDLDASWAVGKKIAARVIAFGPSNYKWARFIDKGAADGIEEDMAVVATDGLVGKVIDVQRHVSTVLLLIDPQGAAGARVEGHGVGLGPTGVIRGNGAHEALSLELIGSRQDVAVFDEVTTSGYDGGIFPPDIPIGRVSEVVADTSALEQEIEVEPYVDFGSLAEVVVLIESGPRRALQRKTK